MSNGQFWIGQYGFLYKKNVGVGGRRSTRMGPGLNANSNQPTDLNNRYSPGGGGVGASSIANRRAKNRLATNCGLSRKCFPGYPTLGLYSQNPNGFYFLPGPIISNTCPPFSSSFTINYDEILAFNCPLDQSLTTLMFSPIISQGTPPGGVFTISQQPNIPGVNTLFTIDSSTGVITIPPPNPLPYEHGLYIFTYTVCGYVIQWSGEIQAC